MNALKSGPVLAAIAFIITIIVFASVFYRSSGSEDLSLKLVNPQKIEHPELLAYSLDSLDGEKQDLTFRCNPTTGEGYFSLKSKDLYWASTHCQDMLGAVKDVEDKKKPYAVVNLTIVDKQVVYRVERNK